MRLTATICVLCAAVLAGPAMAFVPQVMSYQGFMTDDAGVPVDTVVPMTFTIFSDTLGTSTLWTETHASVTVTGGKFTVLLGENTALTGAVLDGHLRGLGIQIDSGPMSDPLVPLATTSYSYRCGRADTASMAQKVGNDGVTSASIEDGSISFDDIGQNGAADGDIMKWSDKVPGWIPAVDEEGSAGTAGGWTDLGTTVRLQTLTDYVGIGTATPDEKLDVETYAAGERAFLKIQSTHATEYEEAGLRIRTPFNMWHLRMDDYSHNNIADSGGLAIRSQNSGVEAMTWAENGYVGVGTTGPKARLHVRGSSQSVDSEHMEADDIVVEDADAVIGLYSAPSGNAGSAISFGEMSGGELVDKWGIARETTGGGSSLRISYGTQEHPYNNPTMVSIETNGKVRIGTLSPDDGMLNVATLGKIALHAVASPLAAGDTSFGVFGRATQAWPSDHSVGVKGDAYEIGVQGIGDEAGVYGVGLTGVYGIGTDESGNIGVHGVAGDYVQGYGVLGENDRTSSVGVRGEATGSSGIGVSGEATAYGGKGVIGKASATGGSVSNWGGWFTANGTYGKGVYAEADGSWGIAVQGIASGLNGVGIYGDGGTNGVAGRFMGDVEANGRVTTEELEIVAGSDLSERFDIGCEGCVSEPSPGMVVCIDPDRPGQLRVSTRAYDPTVVGVISGAGGVKPGMLMGQRGSVADGESPVALTGRVYCLVDATNGPVKPGDLLTTSDTPGHAMRATDRERTYGAVIGKAMTPLDHGQGLVLVLVNLQ